MSRELLEHYLGERSRIAEPSPGSFSGAAGGAACGDLCRLSLGVSDGMISAVTFDAEGCAPIRAAAALVAEVVDGRPLLFAARLGAAEIERGLGGLSSASRHAAELSADALHRALGMAAASPQRLAEAADGRVLVAMSGGVDSAVAAQLLAEAGSEVVAVTLKLWSDPQTDGTKACCSPEAVRGARALAHSRGLPHLTLDLEERFRGGVVDPFVRGYAEGRTPNPCVLCNGEVRIGAMVGLARRIGAKLLATGHYARIAADAEGPLLRLAADETKDQTYMLSALAPELLERLSFPLGELTKQQVRALAEERGLPVARKPESQDLCFLAGQGKRSFLRRHGGLEDREGRVVDPRGRALGQHRGHHHFTVGQRRGIGLAGGEPLYVLAKDARTNTVTVGSGAELRGSLVGLSRAVLHRPSERVDAVKLRYRSAPLACWLEGPLAVGEHRGLRLTLAEPAPRPAPGQTACLLSGHSVVGHGTIAQL